MTVSEIARKTPVHVGSAVVIMGSWAFFTNHAAGTAAAMKAAAVQACASALFTFTLKRSLEWMSQRMQGIAAYIVPPAACSLLVLAILLAAHWLAGTPRIWATISIPYVASASYAWIYAAIVASSRRAGQAGAPATGK
ncbi:MAG TPA: hypothetical protein VGK20_12255 [Candidatus Binatia bacterium]|jgi:hypothetical protein